MPMREGHEQRRVPEERERARGWAGTCSSGSGPRARTRGRAPPPAPGRTPWDGRAVRARPSASTRRSAGTPARSSRPGSDAPSCSPTAGKCPASVQRCERNDVWSAKPDERRPHRPRGQDATAREGLGERVQHADRVEAEGEEEIDAGGHARPKATLARSENGRARGRRPRGAGEAREGGNGRRGGGDVIGGVEGGGAARVFSDPAGTGRPGSGRTARSASHGP